MTQHKRVSELLPTLDSSLDAEIKKEAKHYVCSDCGNADPDPYMALMDRTDGDKDLIFYCPRCTVTQVAKDHFVN